MSSQLKLDKDGKTPDSVLEFNIPPKPLAKMDAMPESLETLQVVAEHCCHDVVVNYTTMNRAYVVSQGVRMMRDLLDREAMTMFRELMDTPLGFVTDRKDKPQQYEMEVVRDCVIHSLMEGLEPVGNQFNIIAGRMYITKNGFIHKINNLPDITNVKLVLGVPKMVGGGAVVECTMTWNKNGKGDTITREIPVRVNSGMGADAILGKAERKIRAAAYTQMTGRVVDDGEISDTPPMITQGDEPRKTLIDKLKGKASATPVVVVDPPGVGASTQGVTSSDVVPHDPPRNAAIVKRFARKHGMEYDKANSIINHHSFRFFEINDMNALANKEFELMCDKINNGACDPS